MMKLEVDKEYWIKARFLGELSKSPNDGPYIPERRYAFRVGKWKTPTSIDFSVEDLEIVEAIPEREKVTIPWFIDDWIEGCREHGYDFAVTLDKGLNDSPEDVRKWLDNANNQDTFARAWLDGYEIEKEPLYTVEIPDPNKIGNEINVLMMNGFRQVVIVKKYGDNWKKENGFRLTESEIKKDFEWAWQWAKPVEEE